jgi:hypothetical protein
MDLRLGADQAARFARLALDCVTREYPNKIAHVLTSAADVRAPRHLTPAFYGCFDWHSAVHGHWLLARVARLFPGESFAREARAALERNITDVNIAGEAAYLSAPGRAGFERPYGLAWLLALWTELEKMDGALGHTLRPLADIAYMHILRWTEKLSSPDRSGQHANTAFALALVLDSRYGYTRRETVRRFYENDANAPIAFEPSGEDFLSPCLAEADLMRRVVSEGKFADWFRKFLPEIPRLTPLTPTDRSDGKLAHLDGLNLSRAWMLRGIASALHPNDSRRRALELMAEEHAEAGLTAVSSEHYEGAHWLGTFAVYLLTQEL